MYLTRIDMPLAHRGVQRALGDCQQMHRRIAGLFADSRAGAGAAVRPISTPLCR